MSRTLCSVFRPWTWMCRTSHKHRNTMIPIVFSSESSISLKPCTLICPKHIFFSLLHLSPLSVTFRFNTNHTAVQSLLTITTYWLHSVTSLLTDGVSLTTGASFFLKTPTCDKTWCTYFFVAVSSVEILMPLLSLDLIRCMSLNKRLELCILPFLSVTVQFQMGQKVNVQTLQTWGRHQLSYQSYLSGAFLCESLDENLPLDVSNIC